MQQLITNNYPIHIIIIMNAQSLHELFAEQLFFFAELILVFIMMAKQPKFVYADAVADADGSGIVSLHSSSRRFFDGKHKNVKWRITRRAKMSVSVRNHILRDIVVYFVFIPCFRHC